MTNYSTLVTTAIAQAYARKEQTTLSFEVGRTYSTSAAGDHNLIYSYKVISRTAKTVTLADDFGHTSRRKIQYHNNGVETVYHDGLYSFCPVLTPDKLTA